MRVKINHTNTLNPLEYVCTLCAWLHQSTFILNMARYLHRSCAGRSKIRGVDEVHNKSAATASWNLLPPPKYSLQSSSTHRFKISSEGPGSFRVWCHSWLTQSHGRYCFPFRFFSRKLTGLNRFSVNKKTNKIIHECGPFNLSFPDFFFFLNISGICIYPDCWTVRTWSGSRWWCPVVPTSGTLTVDLLERPQNLTDIVKSTTWYHESSPDMLQQTWLPLFSGMWRPQLALNSSKLDRSWRATGVFTMTGAKKKKFC